MIVEAAKKSGPGPWRPQHKRSRRHKSALKRPAFIIISQARRSSLVAKRYWEDAAAGLDRIWEELRDPASRLRFFPVTFRSARENENRMCLCSFMGAEYDDLPDQAKREAQIFADVNVAWLQKALVATGAVKPETSEARAKAVFAAVAGAQLMARSRADIAPL